MGGKIESLDWANVVADVRPFLESEEDSDGLYARNTPDALSMTLNKSGFLDSLGFLVFEDLLSTGNSCISIK